MNNKSKRIISALLIQGLLLQCALTSNAHAAISNLPPLVKPNVPPNIFFTLDDSGSMQWEAVPDSTVYAATGFPQPNGVYYGGQANPNDVMGFGSGATASDLLTIYVQRYRSSDYNPLYYDPDTRYDPWIGSNGSPMLPANPLAALFNPIAPSNGALQTTINLTTSAQSAIWTNVNWTRDPNVAAKQESRDFYPATHFRYTGGTGCTGAKTSGSTACFTRVEIKPAAAPFIKTANRTDCVGSDCTYTEEMQNFANWFQYWRSRILMARGGSGSAFAKQATNLRVGFGAINAPSVSINGVSTSVVKRGVSSDFAGTNRSSFFDLLYQHPMPNSGTPLREAMDKVGKYFQRTDIGGPWQNVANTGNTTTDQATCRQNYHILMTDGFWNGNGASNPANQNNDGTNGATMTSSSGATYQYTPVNPYKDNNSDTLADVAMYYWKTDLRPDWATSKKNVPVSNTGVDPAFWQHLVTYTVGLGVVGSLDPTTDLPAITAGTKSWPVPAANSINNVDDLWHAAVNGHGQYFSAGNPKQFANSLATALNDIAARSGDAAAVGTSSNTVRSGAKLYIATYNTKDWSGGLKQLNLTSTGAVSGTDWTIDQNTTWPAPRNVFSYKDSTTKGIAFNYANLATTDQAYFTTAATTIFAGAVNGTDIVNYIKGDKSKEVLSGGYFRDRQNMLGDIVGSSPQFIAQGENEGYTYLPVGTPGQSTYYSFYSGIKKNRGNPRVYVGANDGMLHAFRSSDGREDFAYIPKTVIANLPSLADPAYTHKFYVNGTPTIADAYLGGWKTVLVGSTGAGGRGIYALDITTSANFSSTDVLWEVNSSDDPELGYTIGSPQVGRAPNGDWVAVFGNGYESNSKRAMLFIVNLSTGAITKVDTGVGSAALPNGLATPRLVIDSNSTISAAYAGDLQGNLWKFDFTPSGASVAFSGSRLYQAVMSGKAQPITVQPDLYLHPLGGLIVTFGTGKLFESTDPSIVDIQSIYGVWDNSGIPNVTPTTIGSLSSLVQQTFSPAGTGLTLLSNNSVNWATKRGWYINLAAGERVVIDPEVVYTAVAYTTIIPGGSTDPCITDGTSVNLVIDAVTGGATPFKAFDTNHDNVIDASDVTASGVAGPLTFGNTILRKKGGVISYQTDTKGNLTGGTPVGTGGNLGGAQQIPSLRLWRQILGKD
ncbi:pilus assembly protein [Undibacterium sp. Xuan67W]|uniref:pilus assembly protein n=1 Tax=Undibacterium sp. Xuan67W TaxID=3413057 RepID=UPI003BF36838